MHVLSIQWVGEIIARIYCPTICVPVEINTWILVHKTELMDLIMEYQEHNGGLVQHYVNAL